MKHRLSKLKESSMTELMDIFIQEKNIKVSDISLDNLASIFVSIGYTSDHKHQPIILFLKDNPEAIENIIDYIVEKDYEDWREIMSKNIFKLNASTKEQEIDILEDEIVLLEKELELVKQPILIRINNLVKKLFLNTFKYFYGRRKQNIHTKENRNGIKFP